MTSLLRKAVSSDRRRYKQEEFDLDLTYITPRIVAMGYPASGVEGVYRNHIDDVSRFLEQKHKSHYLVFNLSGRRYDNSKFNDNVLELGWPDHHSPPLHMLFDVCTSMHSWLNANSDNIVVVHCIAGKGRTGVVISSYLLWSGKQETTRDALDFFAEQRSERAIGVQYPSQQRVVKYFEQAIKTSPTQSPQAPELVLAKIVVHGVPSFDKDIGGCQPVVHVMKAPILVDGKEKGETIYRSPWDSCPVAPTQEHLLFEVDRLCKGDVLVRFYHCPLLMQTFGGSGPTAKLMFRFAFHTSFVTNDTLVLEQKDIDVANQEKHAKKFPPNFMVVVYFQTPRPDRVYSKDLTSELVKKVRKEGWLWKQGKFHTAFKKRWFYLNDNYLDYYRSNKESKSICSIPLSEVKLCSVEEKDFDRPNCVALVTKDRKYILSADSEEEIHQWINAICESMTAYSAALTPTADQDACYDENDLLEATGREGDEDYYEEEGNA